MTDSRKAAKMALKALKAINEMSKPPMNIPLAAEIDGAMDALRQAIEQAEKQEKLCKNCGGIGRVVCDGRCMPKQEPVAWMYKNGIYMSDPSNSVSPEFVITPLYTAPPKREWVGLTDDEVHEAAIKCVKSGQSVNAAISAIEALLKERNNG